MSCNSRWAQNPVPKIYHEDVNMWCKNRIFSIAEGPDAGPTRGFGGDHEEKQTCSEYEREHFVGVVTQGTKMYEGCVCKSQPFPTLVPERAPSVATLGV